MRGGEPFLAMMTYSEKLRDPRWGLFREQILALRGRHCETCGPEQSSGKSLHVHHKRYISGLDPWDYDDSDVTVLCEECHGEIHQCENKWRDMIRAMPSWMVLEFDSMADAVKGMPEGNRESWAAYCKNAARSMGGGRVFT